jgi:hypothetical protein
MFPRNAKERIFLMTVPTTDSFAAAPKRWDVVAILFGAMAVTVFAVPWYSWCQKHQTYYEQSHSHTLAQGENCA